MSYSPRNIDRSRNAITIKFPGLFSLLTSVVSVGLIVSCWGFIFAESQGKAPLISGETSARAELIFGQLFGSETWSFTGSRVREIGRLVADTLAMSVISAAMAVITVFVLLPVAARTNTEGSSRFIRIPLYLTARGLFIFTRAVPELMWALVVVFVLSPGIFAGAVALAIHNFGVIGRLGADTVEDAEQAPLVALRSSGASEAQSYLSGVLPLIARQLLTFLFYRWEVIIRTTAVVGFVAASGIGYQLRIDMNLFRYPEVGQLLIAYVLIVWAVDLTSTLVRRAFK